MCLFLLIIHRRTLAPIINKTKVVFVAQTAAVFTVVCISNTRCPLEYFYLLCVNMFVNFHVMMYSRYCILNMQHPRYMRACGHVWLFCTHWMGVEVSPFGLFNRHQSSLLLQEMDAVDYYLRIHKFFMGKLKL